MLKANIKKNVTDEHLTNVIENNIVVGSSATVLNGYAYGGINAPVTVLAENKILDGLATPLRYFVYLPDYDKTTGIRNNITNEERTICDFLMYPKELGIGLYLLDAMEGYEEEFGNFDKVYEMMNKFGIPREKLDEWIPHMWSGGNYCATD